MEVLLMLDINSLQLQHYKESEVFATICMISFEDRALKTARLAQEALELVRPKLKRDFEVTICCDDFVQKEEDSSLVLAYCKSKDQDNVVLIPDFIFVNWKSTGIDDYDKTVLGIYEASKIPPAYNTLFWIGATSHQSRNTLLKLAKKDKRIEAYDMSWKSSLPNHYANNTLNPSTRFVSLADHTKYRYLIDIQGRGYSGRVKCLFFSGRPLFLAERKLYEWWQEDIHPFEHYIPVKEDLSDLSEKLDWADSNPEECSQIARNAQEYALNNLMHKNAVERMGEVLLTIGG